MRSAIPVLETGVARENGGREAGEENCRTWKRKRAGSERGKGRKQERKKIRSAIVVQENRGSPGKWRAGGGSGKG